MNDSITMSVSPVTHNGDKDKVFVLFTDHEKSAEFEAVACKVLRNVGFSEDELRSLSDYVKNEKESIVSIAKTVDPMRAFMTDKG